MKKNYFSLIINNALLFLKLPRRIYFPDLKFLVFILAFFFSLTVTYGQSCNVVKNGTFDTDISNWTSSQASGAGWFVYNNQAYIDRDGANSISLKQTLSGLIGSNLILKFDIRGQNAFRSSNGCNTTAKLEIKIGNVVYMTINNPGLNPSSNTQITLNDVSVLNGASYTQNGFPITVAGSSEAALTQGTITLTIPWSSGMSTADLEFVATASAAPRGTGLCSDVEGGDDWFLSNISVVPSSPTVTLVTVCQGTVSGTLTSLESSTICGNQNFQTGFRNPGAAVSDATTPVPGSIQWVNPGNIISVGTPYATASTTNIGEITRYLKATSYGFSIPTNATIRGITAVINRQSSNNSNNISDNSVKIVKGGVIIGTEKSTGDIWNTSFSTYTYGGSSDLWGTTWLASDINNANFGIVLSAKTNTNDTRALTVDYMQINVTYTLPSSINWYTVSSGGTVVQSDSPFNPINDPEVLAQGAPYSSLGNTNTPGTYTFWAACSSNPECRTPVNFVINPRPSISNMTPSSCSNVGFSATPVNGTNGVVPTGTTYSWPAPSVAGITGAASGANATSISGTLINTTNAAINVVYTVTPTSGSCTGSTFTVTVTVNPRPSISNMTPSSCSNVGFSATPVNGINGVVPAGTTYSWSAPSVAGITGAVSGTNATSISGTLINTTNAAINVIYTVTPTSGSCTGSTFTVTVTVNPRPSISNMTPSSCSTVGFSTTPVNGTNGVVPTGTTYSWPAPSVAGITGAASGANATSISGTLINTTNAAINVVYTVTPTSGSCTGSTFTVTVTVNPRPSISNMTPSSCSNVGFSATPVNGTNGVVPAGTIYSWSAPSVAGITGAASGTNATSISGTLINTTNAAINVVYTVTPTSGSCTGSTFTVTVTVNPRPTISNMIPSSCSTVSFSATPVNGTNGVVPTGTTYSWPAPSVAGITGAASGTNATSISGTLTNTTNAAINVVYTVTPTSGSCTGSTFTVTVTVNPRPTISNMTPSSCSTVGFSATPVNGTNGVVPAGTTYSWSAPSVTGITGAASGTNATSISGTLTNTTNATINVVYTVTPTYGSCTGSTFTVTVTVNPRPSISNMTPSSCSTVGFSATPVNVTNGVVPAGTTYSWSAPSVTGITGTASGTNVTSISGTLTNTTNAAINVIYTVTPTYGSCTGSTFTVTVTVNPRPTISNMTPSSCSNVGFSATPVNGPNGVVPAGTTYSWSAPSVAGITGAASGTNATSISGTLINTTNAAIDVVYTVTPTSGSCTGSTFTVTVTVNTVTTPTAAVTAQPNCSVLTGSITLSGLPTSGTINQTVNNVTTDFPVSQVGGNQTINDLTAGSYTFTVSSGGCTSGASTAVTVVAFSEVIATWNGSAWLPGAPTTNDRAVFNAPYISGSTSPVVSLANVNACSCYVKNGAVVVFNPGHTLNVINEVVVENGGSLTFENNASLVQHNEDPNINSGNIIYKRITQPVNRYDYTYWSSPIMRPLSDPQTLKKLSPDTFYDKYYSYDNGWKVSKYGVAPMEKGKGYIIRAPQTTAISGNPQPYTASFEGVPNNGVITLSGSTGLGLAASQAHLLGNPYPSAIDADVFLNLNSKLAQLEKDRVLEGTLYFWTHNTPPSTAIPGDKKYNYTANDYATYNRTGGTGTAPAKVHPLNYPAGVGNTNFSVPTGSIAAGQGFFAPTKAGGNVVFNNTMRISGGGENGIDGGKGEDNSQFFKLSSGKTATTTVAKTEKSRIWLNLTNSEGAFKQTLVGYITGATNDYDGAFDGVTYNGNAFVDFYSVNNEVNLAIQGRALPFVKKDSVALGYRTTIIGDFQISIDQTDGVLSNQNVFLEDKDLKVLHDLKKEGYTFSTEKGTFNNRFVLRYVDKNAVDEVIAEVSDELNKAIVVALNKNEITIKTDIATIDKVFIYDSAGKKLYQKNKVDAHVFVISHLISSHQVLVVDVVLSDGTKHSKKIIY